MLIVTFQFGSGRSKSSGGGLEQLRRHVRLRSLERVRGRGASVHGDALRDAEVADFDEEVGPNVLEDEDVAGFDVSVDRLVA